VSENDLGTQDKRENSKSGEILQHVGDHRVKNIWRMVIEKEISWWYRCQKERWGGLWKMALRGGKHFSGEGSEDRKK